MARKKDPAAVSLGRKGGKEIAKRGSEYFKELQAKRKTRAGGRPPEKEIDEANPLENPWDEAEA